MLRFFGDELARSTVVVSLATAAIWRFGVDLLNIEFSYNNSKWGKGMEPKQADLLVLGAKKPIIVDGLSATFNLHFSLDAPDRSAFLAAIRDKIRGIAVTYTSEKIDAELMEKLPRL